ncbi:MAG TPA: hypothetical protein VLK29_02365 [Luteimonas sp.]|nr:hypothetical protein [Luteimonas sp.]
MCTAAAPRTSVRSWLRAGTAVHHARVDAGFAGGLRGSDDYRAYLMGLHDLMSAVDAALAQAALAEWRAWRPQARVALLRADLAALAVAPLPPGAPLRIDSGAAAAGALYVLEGSALGARLLARDAEALAVPAAASAFLRAVTGDDAARRWRRFLEQLDRAGVDATGHPHADTLAAATRTFQRAEDAFARARLHDSPR